MTGADGDGEVGDASDGSVDAGSEGAWVSLFSGGKDSSWALYEALRREDVHVVRLVTVHPDGDSYLYHTPATDLADLLAESVGLPLVEVDAEMPGGTEDDSSDATTSVSERGDREIAPLAAALADLDRDLPGGVGGVTAGAVASTFQRDRVAAVCDDLGAELFAPLWGVEPVPALERMLDAGFEIRVVAVAADGLDESWLGRRLDGAAIEELATLHEERGVHPMGEGGEFETLVTDGPHMDRPLELSYGTAWDGTRGHLVIEDARLG